MESVIANNENNEIENVSHSTLIYVKVNDRNVAVKKLGLIKYSEMASKLKGLIRSIMDIYTIMDGNDVNMDTADVIAEFVEKNVEGATQLLQICVSELDIDYIRDEVGLDDFVNLLEAILKVNNLTKVANKAKNLIADLRGTL